MGLRNIFLSLRLKLSSKQFTFFAMFSNFAAFLFWSRLFSILKSRNPRIVFFFLLRVFILSCFFQECKQPITLYTAQKPWNMLPIGMQWFAFQCGLGSTPHLEAGGFASTRDDMPHPDVQFHFLPSMVIDHGRVKPDRHAFQVSLVFTVAFHFHCQPLTSI